MMTQLHGCSVQVYTYISDIMKHCVLDDGLYKCIKWLVTLPLCAVLYYTIPDCRLKRYISVFVSYQCWGYVDVRIGQMAQLPSQCYSNGLCHLANLGSNKEMQPDLSLCLLKLGMNPANFHASLYLANYHHSHSKQVYGYDWSLFSLPDLILWKQYTVFPRIQPESWIKLGVLTHPN